MASIRFINGEAALLGLFTTMANEAKQNLGDRGLNASGKLARSIGYDVRTGIAPTGTLYGLSHWRFAGSGRGPGKMPPVERLVEWTKEKGIADSDSQARSLGFLIARKIGREGSKAYREGGKNAFIEVVEDMAPQISTVVSEYISDFNQGLVTEMKLWENLPAAI